MTYHDPEEYWLDAAGNRIRLSNISEIDQVKEDVTRRLVAGAKSLQAAMIAFKQSAMGEVMAAKSLIFEKYEVTIGGKKGNITLKSFDGTQEVQVAVAENISFGPELQAAKALIDECIEDWATGANDNVRTLVEDAFQVNKSGRIDTGRVLGLRRLSMKGRDGNADARWGRAMSSATNSTSETLAATPAAVKVAMDNADSRALKTTTLTANGLATGGGSLAANRVIDVPKASTAQAQAGTDDATAMTPLKVAQAIAAQVVAATTAVAGIVKLSSATNSTSTTLAATPAAVKVAMDNADSRALKTTTVTGGGLDGNRVITVTIATQAEAQEGTGNSAAMTPFRVKEAIIAQAINRMLGEGQWWRNMTGQRAAGTNYQNTTGRSIQIAIDGVTNTAGHVEVSVDGNSWLRLASTSDWDSGACCIIIPPGHYYRCIGAFSTWCELA